MSAIVYLETFLIDKHTCVQMKWCWSYNKCFYLLSLNCYAVEVNHFNRFWCSRGSSEQQTACNLLGTILRLLIYRRKTSLKITCAKFVTKHECKGRKGVGVVRKTS